MANTKDFLLTDPNSTITQPETSNDQYVMASNAPTIPPPTSSSAGNQADMYRVPTSGVGPSGETIYDVFSGQEHIADPNDPRLKGVDIASLPQGQAPTGFQSKFEQGFNKANAAMGDAAKDVPDGSSIVQQYAPEQRNDLASTFVKTDPYIDGLVKTWQEFINPENQRTSLADTYKQMIADSGIQDLDTELINAKAVIEGTEDDLRREIQSVGGTATESQIIALSAARNKSLIANYNKLVELRNAKSSYLSTMIGLEAQDRQAADQRFESMFNLGLKIADYQQKMQQNSIETLDRVIGAIGWSGLLQSVDPSEEDLIERMYGLPSGGLQIAAQNEIQAQQQVALKENLDFETAQVGLELKKSQLLTEQAQRAKIYSDLTQQATPGVIPTITGKPRTDVQNTALTFAQRMSDADSIIRDVGEQFTGFKSYLGQYLPNFLKGEDRQKFEQAERNFVNAVLRKESGAAISPSEFDSAAQQYFPQPGDSDAVIRQKEANRTTVINGFLAASNTATGALDNTTTQEKSYDDYLKAIQ